jgi:hypothetical protein
MGMLELLVGAACYLTFFAELPGMGSAAQVLAICLLFVAGAWALMTGRVRKEPTSATEIVIYAVAIAFVLVSMPNGDDSILMPLVFLFTIIVISFVVRSVSLEKLLDIGAAVALLCVSTAILVDYHKALAALVPNGARGALDRFTPLQTVPNLVGYIFGAGSILLVRRFLLTKKASEKLVVAVGSLCCCLFVLAASARSSLIGMVAAASIGILLEYGVRRFFASIWVKFATVGVIVLGLTFNERIGSYFIHMLELDSGTRGLGTGGTGRTELWARGLSLFYSDPATFLFGGGFRSSSSDAIGFSTESSYITILLDGGLFMGVALIVIFVFAPYKALRLTPSQNRHDSSLVLLAAFLTFCVVESIFNRYLLAIGNPTSLLSLMVIISLSLRRSFPSTNELVAAKPGASDSEATGSQGVAIR